MKKTVCTSFVVVVAVVVVFVLGIYDPPTL